MQRNVMQISGQEKRELKRWLFQGFCRLGGHYFKSENAIMHGIKFHTTQHQNLRQNIATVPGICFILATIAPISVTFWMIYPLKLNVFSHIIYPLKLMFSAISASCVMA